MKETGSLQNDNDNGQDDTTKIDRVRKLGIYQLHPETQDEEDGLMKSKTAGSIRYRLGTAEPAMDQDGNVLVWPEKNDYFIVKNDEEDRDGDNDSGMTLDQGLAGKPMQGPMTPVCPMTENPRQGRTEIWEIWNYASIAHPIHVSETAMQVVSRHHIGQALTSHRSPQQEQGIEEDDDDFYTYTMTTATGASRNESVPIVLADGFRVGGLLESTPPNLLYMQEHAISGDELFGYTDDFPRDVVTALPHQGTKLIRYLFAFRWQW